MSAEAEIRPRTPLQRLDSIHSKALSLTAEDSLSEAKAAQVALTVVRAGQRLGSMLEGSERVSALYTCEFWAVVYKAHTGRILWYDFSTPAK